MTSKVSISIFLLAGLASAPLLAGGEERSRPARGEDKSGRDAWFWQQRSGPAARIPSAAMRETDEARRLCLVPEPEGAALAWQEIGPDPVRRGTMVGESGHTYAGRALSVALDPSSPGTMLLGTAQGGIWRTTNGGVRWTAVGDGLPSLAIKVIRFAPGDPSIVYAGSGEPHSKTSHWGMGVFKSTDGGKSWGELPSHGKGWDFRFLAVSGLVVHPSDPKTLWVTTANVLPDRIDSFAPPPDAADPGIFKSIDGGKTWRRLLKAVDYRKYDYPAFDPYPASGWGFVDLELFAKDPRVLFAVERSGGIYRTTDGGETWGLATPAKNPGKGAASGGAFPAPVPSFSAYDDATGRFVTWPVLGRSKSTPEFNRIEIGIGQAGGGITSDWRTTPVYAGVGAILQLDRDGDGIFDPKVDLEVPTALIFKSADGGQTWRWLGDWPRNGVPHYCDVATNGYENALYDNTVDVNPVDPSDVVVGGNANYAALWPDPVANPVRLLEIPWRGTIFRTMDGGTTWIDTTQVCLEYVLDADKKPVGGLPLFKCAKESPRKATHPDTHAAVFDTARNRIWIVNDGGIYEGTLSGDGTDGLNDYSWKDANGNCASLQVFLFNSHPTDPDQVLAGMQDNSNAHWNGQWWDAWDFDQGDGTVTRWDPKAPRHVYLGPQYSIARHDNGGGPLEDGWKWIVDGAMGNNDALPFVPIFAIDPVQTKNVYIGTVSGIYRSGDRGDHWSTRLNANPTNGQVTAIAVSPKNPRWVWAGTSTGRVYLYDVQKGEVQDRTGNFLPNRWVSAIVPSARSVDQATIAFSGYDANSADPSLGGNGNVGRVFRTKDRGASWKDVSGNLVEANGLDVPSSALVEDPKEKSHLFLGTDYGVFETKDGGSSWKSVRGNMPLVAVTGLEINPTTGYLLASTFGRGIWRVPLK